MWLLPSWFISLLSVRLFLVFSSLHPLRLLLLGFHSSDERSLHSVPIALTPRIGDDAF